MRRAIKRGVVFLNAAKESSDPDAFKSKRRTFDAHFGWVADINAVNQRREDEKRQYDKQPAFSDG